MYSSKKSIKKNNGVSIPLVDGTYLNLVSGNFTKEQIEKIKKSTTPIKVPVITINSDKENDYECNTWDFSYFAVKLLGSKEKTVPILTRDIAVVVNDNICVFYNGEDKTFEKTMDGAMAAAEYINDNYDGDKLYYFSNQYLEACLNES